MKHLFTLKSLMLTLVMLFGLNAWGQTTLFHETFGDNSSSARVWKDSYSVKSGIEAVYSSVTGYTITDAKQSKNTVGAVKSGLVGTQNKDASIVIGPLNAAACSEMVLTYKWKAGSIKGTYTTSASYATSADGEYVSLEGTGTGATSFVERKYTLPVEAQVSTLYLKIVWNTSNTQAVIDEVDLSGVYSESGFVANPVITETSKADQDGKYYTTKTATATIACDDENAKIKYAITGDDVTDAATISTWKEGTSVSIVSDAEGVKILWAKAVKEGKDSKVVSKKFTFIKEPVFLKYELVVDESQIVEGAKYVIAESEGSAVMGTTFSSKYYNAIQSGFSVSGNILSIAETTAFASIEFEPVADAVGGYTWYVKYNNGDDTYTYLKGSGNDLATSATAEDAASISIEADNSAIIMFASNTPEYYIRYNKDYTRFKTYKESTGNFVYLYRVYEEPAAATSTGLDEVLYGDAGKKYTISTTLRVNYKDANYVYASTIGGGFTKNDAPTLKPEEVEYWSDKEEDFNQNDWVAIEGLDVAVGEDIAGGSTVVLCENAAFPVVKFVSTVKSTSVGAIEANTFRVANFNINNELVKKLWLVEPQPAEHCFVKGYVASLEDVVEDGGLGLATIKSGDKDVVSMYVNYNTADLSITATGWYLFEGIVVNGTKSLELNAVKANAGIETGVEGVEANSVKVYGAEGVINVVSEEVAPIAVYSANGAIVSSVEASSASIAVAPGFYIVKAGNSVSKVTVK